MITSSKLLYIACLVFLFALSGCTKAFNKKEWADFDALGGSDKVLMAEDLIKTNKLLGLTNKQMLELLGPPANDTTATWYNLKEDGEFLSPDPASGKNLVIQFNKDSVIISAKIEEWHKH